MDEQSALRAKASAILPRLRDPEPDSEVGFEAAVELARLGRPVLPIAMEWAYDADPILRERACLVLRLVGEPPSPWNNLYPDGIPTLLDVLKNDESDDVRAAAASALGFHKDLASLPALIEASEDASDIVRFETARALGSFFDSFWEESPDAGDIRESVIDALLRRMDDPDDDVRDWAAFGIHQGGHDTFAVRQRLWAALEDPNCDVRGEAALGLAKLREPNLAASLRRLLDEDPISPCYFEAAGELGDPALLPNVIASATKWRALLEREDHMHAYMDSAIEILTQAADGAGDKSIGND